MFLSDHPLKNFFPLVRPLNTLLLRSSVGIWVAFEGRRKLVVVQTNVPCLCSSPFSTQPRLTLFYLVPCTCAVVSKFLAVLQLINRKGIRRIELGGKYEVLILVSRRLQSTLRENVPNPEKGETVFPLSINTCCTIYKEYATHKDTGRTRFNPMC